MAALTKEQLEAEVAAWREHRAGYEVEPEPVAKEANFAPLGAKDANLAPLGAKAAPAVPKVLIAGILKAVAPFVYSLEQQVTALATRVQELEAAQGEMRYCGVWRSEKEFSAGSFATHAGALWHANRRTSAVPGNTGDWTMVAKGGVPVSHARNGHDTAARPRSP
jgi:hypothetical protein